MIKIEYNFHDDYSPATSISNDLTAGSTQTPTANVSETNKKFIDEATTILDLNWQTATGTITVTGASQNIVGSSTLFSSELSTGNKIKTAGGNVYTVNVITDDTHLSVTETPSTTESGVAYAFFDVIDITFTNCLFVNCTKIIDIEDLIVVGTIKFVNCTVYDCDYIINSGTATGTGITIEDSIIWKTPFMNTAIDITFTNSKASTYQSFVGYTGTLTANDSIQKNPMFISIDTDDLPHTVTNPTGLGFVIMSKSRGYLYDSPALDMGCWAETRAGGTPTNDSRIFSYVPDDFSKALKLIGFNSYTDVNGVARSTHNSEKTMVNLRWSKNGLTNDDMQALLDMMSADNNQIKIYPDSTDSGRYITARLLKGKETSYQKINSGMWDSQLLDNQLFSGATIIVSVESLTGADWL